MERTLKQLENNQINNEKNQKVNDQKNISVKNFKVKKEVLDE